MHVSASDLYLLVVLVCVETFLRGPFQRDANQAGR